jgi:glycosyltransferase involved in cell wall biosynthesis
MKVLWLNWRCWLNPAMGGAEVFTYEVAKRWVSCGHEVCLFTSNFVGSKAEEIVDGIKIVRAGGRFTVFRKAKEFYLKRFKNEGFDVVIDEINTKPFFAPSFVNNGEKVIALIHQLAREYWFFEMPFPVNYVGYYFLENRWLRQYIDVPTVTVSESTLNDLKSLGFKHLSIVPEGLNFEPLAALPEKSDVPIVVFSGRLKRAKRPDHAIISFQIVKEKMPSAELWVFGDGPMKDSLKRRSKLGVTFFGNIENGRRRELISKSWVLVASGVREGWGLNIVEANALGVPSVAYNVHGLRDSVKNKKTGLLVEAGNVEKLAEALVEVLRDRNKRLMLSANALSYAKEFNWDRTAKAFMELIA